MTNQQRQFCTEYMYDCDGEAAARRMGLSIDKALSWLADPEVNAEITRRLDEAASVAQINAERVLAMYWKIATADVSELVSVHLDACPYCYGAGHKRQYVDYQDMVEDCARRKLGFIMSEDMFGGYGYDPRREPVHDCPHCFGRGVESVHVADTRRLSENGKLLYEGAKYGKYGVEMNIRNRADALEVLAKYTGLDKKTLEVSGGQKETSQLTDEELARIIATSQE